MKIFFLSVFFCSCFTRSRAQFDNSPEQRYGIKAGVNYNMMNFNMGSSSVTTPGKNKWKPGFYLGATLQFPLNQTFALQPEYVYTYMPGEDAQTNTKYTLYYLSLPVLLRVALGERWALIAGPEFSLLIHSKKTVDGISSTDTHDTEERSVSAVGGIEAKITGSFYADARFLYGLNHVGLGQRSAIKEFKWRSVEVGIGWRW